MKRALIAILLSTSLLTAQKNGPPPPLLGFDTDGTNRERGLEQQFDANIKKDDLRDWMKRLSAHPHHLGSAYDKDNADFIA
ncbi:MAG TPA: folate hydrolase, partial [Terriglobia bacterium]|nr:folate hydrolase [Terriglobia bacterium]